MLVRYAHLGGEHLKSAAVRSLTTDNPDLVVDGGTDTCDTDFIGVAYSGSPAVRDHTYGGLG